MVLTVKVGQGGDGDGDKQCDAGLLHRRAYVRHPELETRPMFMTPRRQRRLLLPFSLESRQTYNEVSRVPLIYLADTE